MRYVIAVLIAVIIIGASFLGSRISSLQHGLQSEKSAHFQTKQELETARKNAELLAENARRCLAREAQAQADAAERNAILANATERERTPQEKENVADEATRSAVINRLNRGLRH